MSIASTYPAAGCPLTNMRLKVYDQFGFLIWTSSVLAPAGGLNPGDTYTQTVGANDSGANPPSNPSAGKLFWDQTDGVVTLTT